MKTLILLLISLWLGTQPFYAKDGNTTSTTTETEKKEIPLNVMFSDGAITYSFVQPAVYAYLLDKEVSVDLSELPGTFTVRIISLSTGKEVASQTFCEFVEIDLSACSGGDYQLDIMSEDEWLQGEFTL
ncbi:DUF3244 domain-containing protein [uncultured Bacteroides sp.]|uniref:DUF3244 domain-containing protein n=1 Tax=uncultured Bacteroides sp. TaxID=162156 RepID=UPI00262AF437|nr:DUF3244 domain-containing protein [uncultured Bacteroides sp.]